VGKTRGQNLRINMAFMPLLPTPQFLPVISDIMSKSRSKFAKKRSRHLLENKKPGLTPSAKRSHYIAEN